MLYSRTSSRLRTSPLLKFPRGKRSCSSVAAATLLLASLTFLPLTTTSEGTGDLKLDLIGRWPALEGSLSSVTVRHDVAALGFVRYQETGGTTGGFALFDVSSPAEPELMCLREGFTVTGIQIVGNHAYVAASDIPLQVFDISNPWIPRLVSSIPGSMPSAAVFSDGDFLYSLTKEKNGPRLQIFDCTEPAQAKVAGEVPLTGTAIDLDVSNGFVYAALYTGGLQVVDVKDAANPKVIAAIDTDGFTQSVRVKGGRAFVGDQKGYLRILDVTDPSHPRPVASFGTSGPPYGIEVIDNVAYIAQGVVGLQVVDITIPSEPKHSGLVPLPTDSISIQGRGAYIIGRNGLFVVDITNPIQPVGVQQVPAGYYSWYGRVKVNGGYAFLVDNFGLQIIDVKDGKRPRQAAGFPYAQGRIEFNGNYAYLTGWGSDPAGLLVLDLTNPASPVRVGSFLTGTRDFDVGYGVQVHSGVVYATVNDALYILDATTPTNLVPIKRLEIEQCESLHLHFPFLYVSSFDRGVGLASLRILDVSDPRNPRDMGALPLPWIASDRYRISISSRDNLLFVATPQDGLRIFNTDDPGQPKLLGSYLRTDAVGVAKLVDRSVYLVAGTKLLRVNVENPNAPVLAEEYDLGVSPHDLDIAGDRFYVASHAGLSVFDRHPEPVATTATKKGTSIDIMAVGSPLNRDWILESSPDLLTWQSVATNRSASSLFHYYEPIRFTNQFYRSRIQ